MHAPICLSVKSDAKLRNSFLVSVAIKFVRVPDVVRRGEAALENRRLTSCLVVNLESCQEPVVPQLEAFDDDLTGGVVHVWGDLVWPDEVFAVMDGELQLLQTEEGLMFSEEDEAAQKLLMPLPVDLPVF